MSNDSNAQAAQAPEGAEKKVEAQAQNQAQDKAIVADVKPTVEAPMLTPAADAKSEAPEEPKPAKAKPRAKEKEKEKEKEAEDEEKVLEEKVMTINLRHAFLTYGRKATPKAVRLVKRVTCKAFKTEDVSLDNSLNEFLWARGKTKTARRVAVKVQKLESGKVRVLPAEA